MMSGKRKRPSRERLTAHFFSVVAIALENMVLERQKLSGSVTLDQIAKRMGADKSFVHRLLSGTHNAELRSLSNLMYALEVWPEEIKFCTWEQKASSNLGPYLIQADDECSPELFVVRPPVGDARREPVSYGEV